MAKNSNGKFKLISLIITLAILLIGGVSGYVWTQADVRANTVQIVTIKKEGSDVAKEAKTNVSLIQKDIGYIQRDIGKILEKMDEK